LTVGNSVVFVALVPPQATILVSATI